MIDYARWNFEVNAGRVEVCKDYHDKGSPCEYQFISAIELCDIITEQALRIRKLEERE